MPVLSPTRRLGAGALATVGLLALSACGTNNNSTTPTSTASAGGGMSVSGGSSGQCAKGTLTASGSTAQANAMSAWVKSFQQSCPDATINYGGGGSGQGVEQFTQGTTDFGGSDAPLNADAKAAAAKRCGGNAPVNLPMVPGPIAVAYNLPGVKNLRLSAATIAGIFSGKITKWNDGAITKDNPGMTLPSTGIQSFHRSDGSGTTFNFTNYLENDAKSAWTFGHDKAWKASGGQGAKGSAGVAQGVKSTVGAIGYMEQSFATQNNLPFAKVGNATGAFVELTAANTISFLSEATPAGTGGDLALKFDYANSDPKAYPAVLVTYEIVCQNGNKADKLPLLKAFFTSISSAQGQDMLPANGYVKLPANLQSKVSAAVSALS